MKEIKVKLNLKELDKIFNMYLNDNQDLKEMYKTSSNPKYTKYVILGWAAFNNGRKDIKDRIYSEILDNIKDDKKSMKHLMDYLKNGQFSVHVMKRFNTLLDEPEQFRLIQV